MKAPKHPAFAPESEGAQKHSTAELAPAKEHAIGRRRGRIDRCTRASRHRILTSFWNVGSSGKVADSHNVQRAGILDEAVISLRRHALALDRRIARLEGPDGKPSIHMVRGAFEGEVAA